MKENEKLFRKNELEIIALLSGMIRQYKETKTLHDVQELICKTADDILDLCDSKNTDVKLSLPSEENIREPIQDALYATRHFLTDQCTKLANGILDYLNDAGFKVVKK